MNQGVNDIIIREWLEYKKDIENSIQKTIDSSNHKEILELVLHLLQNSKVKNRNTEDTE